MLDIGAAPATLASTASRARRDLPARRDAPAARARGGAPDERAKHKSKPTARALGSTRYPTRGAPPRAAHARRGGDESVTDPNATGSDATDELGWEDLSEVIRRRKRRSAAAAARETARETARNHVRESSAAAAQRSDEQVFVLSLFHVCPYVTPPLSPSISTCVFEQMSAADESPYTSARDDYASARDELSSENGFSDSAASGCFSSALSDEGSGLDPRLTMRSAARQSGRGRGRGGGRTGGARGRHGGRAHRGSESRESSDQEGGCASYAIFSC